MPTFSSLISDNTWLTFTSIQFALIVWAFDRPKGELGKRYLTPIWGLALLATTISILCFIFDKSLIGKRIITCEFLIIGVGGIFIGIIGPLLHWLNLSPTLRFHRGIGKGSYFPSDDDPQVPEAHD